MFDFSTKEQNHQSMNYNRVVLARFVNKKQQGERYFSLTIQQVEYPFLRAKSTFSRLNGQLILQSTVEYSLY